MTKEKADRNQNDTPLGLRENAQEEVLELSSTGYGFESVSKETIENDPVTDPPNC